MSKPAITLIVFYWFDWFLLTVADLLKTHGTQTLQNSNHWIISTNRSAVALKEFVACFDMEKCVANNQSIQIKLLRT